MNSLHGFNKVSTVLTFQDGLIYGSIITTIAVVLLMVYFLSRREEAKPTVTKNTNDNRRRKVRHSNNPKALQHDAVKLIGWDGN